MSLPLRLWNIKEDIRKFARDYGLDFFDVVFEVVSNDKINEIAAYGGFPVRYPHWRFGMDYERMAKSHLYGLHKIYEMVINNDPCYAYLVEGSSDIDYKLVMAHVYAHSDFFKRNMWFSHTNRKMMDEMANHATRVRRYVDRYGTDRVERFVDACLSLDNLIDYHFPQSGARARDEKKPEEDISDAQPEHRFAARTPEYMESYLYPKEYVDAARKKHARELKKTKKVPQAPEKDVLAFLVNYAPLEEWERDIVSIVREEALYFAPQGQTKIMNEGWAAYWHSKILTEKALTSAEIVDFADHHSMAVAIHGFQINPYKLGLELFRDIEDRYDRGRFGKEWDECRDQRARAFWDRKLGQGRERIFQVRAIYNDVSFLDEFLTPQFCIDHKLFTWTYKEEYDRYVIDSTQFEKVKDTLLSSITNFGHPTIHVVDSNFRNRGELLLKHVHESRDLDVKYAREVLASLALIWRRPVHVLTLAAGREEIWSHNGKEFGSEKYTPEEETVDEEESK